MLVDLNDFNSNFLHNINFMFLNFLNSYIIPCMPPLGPGTVPNFEFGHETVAKNHARYMYLQSDI